jgi:hypothetical protein
MHHNYFAPQPLLRGFFMGSHNGNNTGATDHVIQLSMAVLIPFSYSLPGDPVKYSSVMRLPHRACMVWPYPATQLLHGSGIGNRQMQAGWVF